MHIYPFICIKNTYKIKIKYKGTYTSLDFMILYTKSQRRKYRNGTKILYAFFMFLIIKDTCFSTSVLWKHLACVN